jgi:hypothetical protein
MRPSSSLCCVLPHFYSLQIPTKRLLTFRLLQHQQRQLINYDNDYLTIIRVNRKLTTTTTRFLSTSTTPPITAVVNTTDEDNTKRKNGIPWGLLISTSILGGIIFWFYRGSRSASDRKTYIQYLSSQCILSPEEVLECREQNNLSARQFTEIVSRVKKYLINVPGIIITRDYFNEFLPNILGGEFQVRGKLKSAHLL